ncbi:MAG: hypothetical protein JJT94_13975 [Bernardetiaceae bacterium]|nr:hypothetical protein [Bernardetiaceae bacterium]
MTTFRLLFFSFMILLCSGLQAWAQSDDEVEIDEEMSQRIESLRIAILTETLELTPEQAAKFFPLYKELRDKQRHIKDQMRNLRRNKVQKSDAEIKADMKQFFALRREEINLEETYFEKFTAVVSARQAASVYRAERKLRRMLLESIGGSREGKRRRE